MGMRVRLKASVDISRFPPDVQVILTGLRKYGMTQADNGGGFFVSGAPDPRWNDANIDTLKRIKGSTSRRGDRWPVRLTPERPLASAPILICSIEADLQEPVAHPDPV
jgi:hypothetical protein